MYGEAYSTSSLRGTEHAFSFNFIVCRELVMTVNIPVQERNAICRIVASAGVRRASTTYLYKKGMLFVGSLLAREFDALVLKSH